jgi:hypothetical protein
VPQHGGGESGHSDDEGGRAGELVAQRGRRPPAILPRSEWLARAAHQWLIASTRSCSSLAAFTDTVITTAKVNKLKQLLPRWRVFLVFAFTDQVAYISPCILPTRGTLTPPIFSAKNIIYLVSHLSENKRVTFLQV